MEETRAQASVEDGDASWVPGWGHRWQPLDYLVCVVVGALFMVTLHAVTVSWSTAAVVTLLLMAAALALRLWRVRRVEAERKAMRSPVLPQAHTSQGKN